MLPIYGEAQIAAERPFSALSRDSTWLVRGFLAPGRLGGVALVEILKRDGRILRVTHGE